jgi:hypothetical protein
MSHHVTTPEPVEPQQSTGEPALDLEPSTDDAGLDSNAFEQVTLDRIIESLGDDWALPYPCRARRSTIQGGECHRLVAVVDCVWSVRPGWPWDRPLSNRGAGLLRGADEGTRTLDLLHGDR